MAIITNMETEILISPEESYIQHNTNLPDLSTITIDNRGYLDQSPTFVVKLNTVTTPMTITNVTTGISITIPSDSIISASSLTIYNDAVYKNSASTLTEVPATFTGMFDLKENVNNTISFAFDPGTINVDTTWIKPNGNAAIQCFVEGFSINENIGLKAKSNNPLNKYVSGYLDQTIDYDISIDKLWEDNQFISIDTTKSYRITYQTASNIGAILPQLWYLCNCKFSSYGVNQASTQQTDACKENIKGKGVKLLKG